MPRWRRPWFVPFGIACGSLVLFWICRSAVYDGDGDQIARFIEAGIWFIRTEILSQAIFQLVYRVCSRWGWDGLLVMNLVSCLSGAILVYFFLQIGEDLGETRFTLPFVLSSGFIVLACGHTEYYPQLLAALVAWNWSCIRYVQGRGTLLVPSLLFSLCAWLHQEVLFAFPAQFFLPFLRKEPERWVSWTLGLIPLGFLFVVRFIPQLSLLRLEGMPHGWNTVPLWTTEGTEKLYSMFEWAHWRDVLYALGRRSILAWPVIIVAVLAGWRGMRQSAKREVLSRIRVFLLAESGCFWALCILWHPNLGIAADWDLFVVEAIPSTILALSFVPELISRRFLYFGLISAILFSGFLTWQGILDRAQFGHRDRGGIEITVQASKELLITLDGHQKRRVIASVVEGRHYLKIIDPTQRWAINYVLVVAPNRITRVVVNPALDIHPKAIPAR